MESHFLDYLQMLLILKIFVEYAGRRYGGPWHIKGGTKSNRACDVRVRVQELRAWYGRDQDE